MYAKALREQMGRNQTQLQAIIDKCKAEGNRGLTPEEQETFNRMVDEDTRLEESIKAAEKADGIANRLAAGNGAIEITSADVEQLRDEYHMSPAEKRRKDNEKNPHARAFSSYLRAGEHLSGEDRQVLTQQTGTLLARGLGIPANLLAQFKNAQSGLVGSQGGDLIPQGFSNMLEEAKKWFGGIEGTVERFPTGTGNPMPWPTLNDTTNRGRIIGQNVQVIETDLAFNQVTFQAYIGSSDLVLVPLALLQDSYFDLDALVAKLLGIRLGRLFNWKCTVGTGTNEPTGIVNASVTAGNIVTFPGGETASIAYNDLVNVEHAVDPAYRENPSSKWMFSDTILKLLKKLVDSSNRPLWQPGLTASFQQGAAVMTGSKPKILEHEYVINQDMAVPAASAYSVLFGDMSCFKVRDVAGGTTVMVLRERYADYLQVGYTAFQRFDSNLIDAGTHPIAVGQQSAS